MSHRLLLLPLLAPKVPKIIRVQRRVGVVCIHSVESFCCQPGFHNVRGFVEQITLVDQQHVPPPFTPSVTLYARDGQPVVCPVLRGRSPARSVAPKQPSPVHALCHPLRARGRGRRRPAATSSLASALGRAEAADGAALAPSGSAARREGPA